ncbi:MAG: hypothetical protein AB1414_21490 [bacterium]
MGDREIGVRSDVFFTFYSLLPIFRRNGHEPRLTKGNENGRRTTP